MGANSGYRTYRNDYVDNGEEFTTTVTNEFLPDFKSRHTIQVWNASADNNVRYSTVERWVGETLIERSLHDITVVNNGAVPKTLFFHPLYKFIDEQQPLPLLDNPMTPPVELLEYFQVQIPAHTTAHFYASAIFEDQNLILVMRGGSQDTRN